MCANEILNTISIDHSLGIVTKKSRPDNHVNQLLETFLSGYYSEPLIDHEVSVISRLEKYDIAPKVLRVGPGFFEMTYEGEPLGARGTQVDWDDLGIQARRIVEILKTEEIRHADIHRGNLLVDENGSLKLVDFAMASIGNIRGVESIFEHFENPDIEVFCARWTDDVILEAVKAQPDYEQLKRNIVRSILQADIPPHALMDPEYAAARYYSGTVFRLPIVEERKYSSLPAEFLCQELNATGLLGLDVGCCTGGISFDLAIRGQKMTGVDRDSRSILLARNINKYKGLPVDFVQCDYDLALWAELPAYDFCLFQSRVKPLLMARGREYYMRFLTETSKKTNLLFYEVSSPSDAPFGEAAPGQAISVLQECTEYKEFVEIGTFDDSGERRHMVMCR